MPPCPPCSICCRLPGCRSALTVRVQAIVALMRDAMSQRPALARAADRWVVPFLRAVLLLAVAAAAVWK